MLGKRPVTWVLVSAVAVAAVFGPLWGVRLGADVNGDHAVDVLDAQALVVAALLAESAAGDLNADGAMDILDLQCLLGGTEQATLPKDEEGPSSSDDATLPHPLRTPVLALTRVHPSAALPEPHAAVRASLLHLGDDVCPVAHARQFLRELTPHAPPVYA